MKANLLAFVFLPTILFAQTPLPVQPVRRVIQSQPQPEGAPATFPDNYQITLKIADKDAPPLEFSVVTGSSRFTVTFAEHALSFLGTLTLEESGNATVAYSLGWETSAVINNNPQYRSSSAQASVHLKLGEEVQIIRAGTRVTTLSIEKLAPEKSK